MIRATAWAVAALIGALPHVPARARPGLALAAMAAFWSGPIQAAECRNLRFENRPYTVCTVDPAQEDLRLFHLDAAGSPLGWFSAIEAQHNRKLIFAMNAGMYHSDRSPVGLYRENGHQTQRLITSAGPGNFGLLPNGVLCLNADSAQVIETKRFASQDPECRDATQSGPMLVIDGALHPRFIPNSDSRFIRNGVGVDSQGRVHFAISGEAVNFDSFARLFRDELHTPNALFLDGKVSRLYAPALGRDDFGFAPLGPMVGVLAPKPGAANPGSALDDAAPSD